MESVVMENCPINVDENQDVKGSQSAENFQQFMYELFEKNGVMNDLRSYLRGHIVNVLRSAQTGDPPSCQKHFTQRLELTFQALNILIAEYLLRLEFSYSLSVFISEIPLANMIFSFAKTLMKKMDNDDSRPRFNDSDVWCILNYLGVKCDSEHASSIVEMYRLERNSPLLLCILKTAPLFKEPIVLDQLNSSQDSLSSQKSSGSDKTRCHSKPSFQEKCRHYVFCKTCQSKIMRVKDKYKRKKKDIAKNIKETSLSSLNVESLMKNISLMERSLIDEMFDQLKSVYEAEMELLKQEEDKRVKKSLASHTTQLQKRRDEMEESFKAREAELENNVKQKKRFLWGLARALREQHQHMTRAMHDVRAETSRLTAKEDSLKAQLAEAEQVLRQRGEAMRQQITEELSVLEGHLECMKKERDSINRERAQLEQYKDRSDERIESEDLKPHYDLLKNELDILKKYLASAKYQPKCVIERGTVTDLCVVTSDVTSHNVTSHNDTSRNVTSHNNTSHDVLNNEQEVRARGKPKQLVNDLKKPKNVNFSQSNLDEMFRERSRSRSRSSASSEAGDAQFLAERDPELRLREENEHLRRLATQQRSHIDSLTLEQSRLQSELAALRASAPPAPAPAALRPRTAPAVAAYTLEANNQRLSASASVNNFSFGWRKGAGEELSLFSHARPRILLPGDPVPFVGTTRHTDNRRYLINQWRTLRRRMSPLSGGITKPRAASPLQRDLLRPDIAGPSVRLHLNQIEDVSQPTPDPGYHPTCERTREKSPKSMLREAKEKLRNNESKIPTPTKREKSPNCVLREAKMRLRKLEIEAEAVERSYLDFRRKQDAFRGELDKKESANMETKSSTTTYKLDETYTKESTSRYQSPTNEYDRYFKEYQSKISVAGHFKNNNTAAVRMNPIPNAYSTQPPKTDYIETPITEFRKYYQSERLPNDTPASPEETKKGTRKEIIRQAKHDKIKELEILKQNIGKIYNMPEQAIVETPPTNEENNEVASKESKDTANDVIDDTPIEKSNANSNLLRIEVESVTEVNDMKPTESQTQGMLLIVESSVDNNRDVEVSDVETDKEVISHQMTIIISPKSISPTRGGSEIININPKEESISEVSDIKPKSESINSPRRSLKSPRIGSIRSEKLCISPRKKNINSGGKNEKYDSMTTDNVVAFYHSDRSSVQTKQESKEVLDNTLSELEQNEDPDYADDFSADVDNYNSRSDYENNSPISLPKTSEDENFWDS